MRRPPLVGWVLVGLALFAPACKRRGGDSPEAVQTYVTGATPAAKQSLDALKAITQETLSMPPLTADGTYDGAPANADFEDVALLAITFSIPTKLDAAMSVPNRWSDVLDAVNGNASRYSSVAEAQSAFTTLSAVKYVFVVKTLQREDPIITSSGARGTFKPGHVAAEAHLYTLDGGKRRLGGFRFRAQNSENLQVSATKDTAYDKAKQEAVSDLNQQSKAAFTDGVKRFSGGKLTLTY